ncbi:MAG: diguanylate cyclase [Planctomycetes bacterium]|nr:diguanylate cyclase [Planctomycetota bacterium]
MGSKEYSGKPYKLFWIILGTALIPSLWVIDYLAGPDIAMLIFYLVPIFIFTWFVGWWSGMLISFLSAVLWLTVDMITSPAYVSFEHDYLDTAIQLAFFFITVSVLTILRVTIEREKKLARIDPLTGIANGRYFLEQVQIELYKANRYHYPISLAYLDVDNFKDVNDTFGHSVGNTTLRIVAETMKQNVRLSDTVARLGGDEFAILLPQTDSHQAMLAIDKLQKVLLGEMQKNRWLVTFSIGLISCPTPPFSVDAMLKKADELMYSVKNSGKNMIKQETFTDK